MAKDQKKKEEEKKEVGRPEKPVKFAGTLEDMIDMAVHTPAKKTK